MNNPTKEQKKKVKIINGSEVAHFILVTVFLFAFWLLMSGQLTPKHLTIGFLTALGVAWITRPLLRLPSAKDPNSVYLAFFFPWHKLFRFFLWVIKEIFVCNIALIKLVLHPKMPIDPVFVKFKKKVDNPLAHAVLGENIVITPGTVTIEIENDVYLVHAITREMGEALARPDGKEPEISRRVAAVFNELHWEAEEVSSDDHA